MKIKKLLISLLAVSLTFAMFSCGETKENKTENGSGTSMTETKKSQVEVKENPIVKMEIKGYGTIEMELYPNVAPETVNNFVYLINEGFYNENTVHRVQAGFVLQGGDPTGTGSGGPGYTIKGEFASNGVKNDLSHARGVVSMARRSDSYDSAGSQFFICIQDASYSLDGDYAAFGKVTKGMDIVDKIAAEAVVVDRMGKLKNNLTITKTTVDTKGVTYPKPNMIK